MFTEAGVFLEHKVTAPYCSYSVMKRLLCATSLTPRCDPGSLTNISPEKRTKGPTHAGDQCASVLQENCIAANMHYLLSVC